MVKLGTVLLGVLSLCTVLRAEPLTAYVQANALPISLDFPLSSELLQQLANYKVFTLGEVHGTEEGPQTLELLVKNLHSLERSVLVALEIPETEQKNIDWFMQTGDIQILKNSPFFNSSHPEGRSSRAMADLLNNLRKYKLVTVLCFDPALSTSGQDRDEKMAVNILRAYQASYPQFLVVLAGNIHTAINVGNPFDPNYRPMGYQLHKQAGSPILETNILSIRLRNRKGDAWTCLANNDCGVHSMDIGPSVYSESVAYASYFLKEAQLNQGHNASFFVRELNASYPLVMP